MKLTKETNKVHKVAMECIKNLVIKHNYSVNQAEAMVMETLKECVPYLQSQDTSLVIATLKMTYLDVSLTNAAKSVLKSFK